MRLANRLLVVVIGAGMVALATVTVVEVALGLLARPAWLVDRAGWHAALGALTWREPTLLLTAVLAVVVGVALLVLQLAPHRPHALTAREGASGPVAVERRSLEGHLAEHARRDADVAAAAARVRRRRATVTVRLVRRSDRRAVRERLAGTLREQLGELDLARPPAVRVRTRPGTERVR